MHSRDSLYEAGFEAQKLAFAPVSFMISLCMERMGVWRELLAALGSGCTPQEIAQRCDITPYAARILLESSLAIGSVRRDDERYHITKLGHVLAKDPMTRANFNFIFDVCYKGLAHLEEALRTGRPSGLAELGAWETVYEGLKDLPKTARQSWFEFDHFYSDSAFKEALALVFDRQVTTLLDVGGNTGRFTQEVLRFNPDVKVTIADLAQQVALAKSELDPCFKERVFYHPVNLLKEDAQLPGGYDCVWMSQFLVCFSEPEILRILSLSRPALKDSGRLLVLDTFWDLQKDEASRYGVIQTSPYFTAIANGNSKMYESRTIISLAERAGLKLNRTTTGLGLAHSLLEFS